MGDIVLGNTQTGQLRIDIQKLIDSRILIQANSGGGKSWALRYILEKTHGHVQHLVIDTEGEFPSLRERFDYVLAAKSGGDTSADPRSAKLLAERLLELGVSAILDIYELKAHERIRFVKEFLEALVDAPKKLWHPALVVVDEAHVFCPQAGEAESAGAVIDLATRGRKRGFCAALATQRLSKLHKDAAAELNNKLIGRTGLDVDVKRAADELGFGKDRWRELRELPPGDFFGFGPAISREVQAVRVGQVVTTHPKAGARLAFTAPPPTAKVRALLPKLADLPAEAEERKRTTDELRQEVATLKRELAAAVKRAPAPAAPKVVEKAVVKAQTLSRLESASMRFHAALALGAQQARSLMEQYQPLLGDLTAALRAAAAPPAPGRGIAALIPERPAEAPPRSRPAPAQTNSGEPLTGPEQRILDALAWLETIGQTEPELAAVAFLAGYTVGGGAFNNPRGALRTKGLIAYKGDRLALTEAGRARASYPAEDLTADELQRRVLERLPGPEQRLLRELLKAYPDSLENDDLARRAGYEPGGGAFNNPRGRLRSLGLVDYPERGRVVARGVLFLEA